MPRRPDAKHCVTVVRMNPASLRLYERGQARKPRWDVLGERCFKSKAAKDRYVARMTRFRAGRARIAVE